MFYVIKLRCILAAHKFLQKGCVIPQRGQPVSAGCMYLIVYISPLDNDESMLTPLFVFQFLEMCLVIWQGNCQPFHLGP